MDGSPFAYCDGKEWNGTKPECHGKLDQFLMISAHKCRKRPLQVKLGPNPDNNLNVNPEIKVLQVQTNSIELDFKQTLLKIAIF